MRGTFGASTKPSQTDVDPTDHEGAIFPAFGERGVVTIYYVSAIVRRIRYRGEGAYNGREVTLDYTDRGHSYYAGYTTEFCNNVLVLDRPNYYTLAHELAHILYNGGHPKRKYSLRDAATTEKNPGVHGTKRIGPYRGEQESIAEDEEKTMRNRAARLPVPGCLTKKPR